MNVNYPKFECSEGSVQWFGNDGGAQVRTKRHMVSRSCIACRSLKKKCDEQRPCSRCQGKGEQDKCVDWEPQHKSYRKDTLGNGDGRGVAGDREDIWGARFSEHSFIESSLPYRGNGAMQPICDNSAKSFAEQAALRSVGSNSNAAAGIGFRGSLGGQNHHGGGELPDLGMAAAAAAAALTAHLDSDSGHGRGAFGGARGTSGLMGMVSAAAVAAAAARTSSGGGFAAAMREDYSALPFPPPLLPVQVPAPPRPATFPH